MPFTLRGMAKGELHLYNWLRHRPKKEKGRAEMLRAMRLSALYWLEQYMQECGKTFGIFKAVTQQKG